MPVDSPYPGSVADATNLPDVTQFVDTYQAAHMNNVRAFIRDMSAAIGANPQGNKASLIDRVSNVIDADGNLLFNANVATVAPSGAQFTSIQAAIDSLTQANWQNPCIVLVFPGTYEEDIDIKSFINIQALNPGSTWLKGKLYCSSYSDITYVDINIKNDGAPCIHIENPDTFLYYTGTLKCENAITVRNYESSIWLYGELDGSDAFHNLIENSGGYLRCYSRIWTHWDGGTLIKVNYGNVDIHTNFHCYREPLVEHNGGKTRLFNSHMFLGDNSSGQSPIVINSSGLYMYNCIIHSQYTNVPCVHADSAQSFLALNSFSNVALGANVTNLVSGGLTVDSNVF